jgi:hypothetical protein
MTFLLDEDEALRNLLKGLTVTDQKAASTPATTRSVGVWFGQPDQEITDQKYPYITIDMIDVAEDYSRAHRGRVKPAYIPDPTTIDGESSYNSDFHNWDIQFPIPVNIDYQVTTYARQPRHDRQILGQLMYTKLPLRFGTLEIGNNTVYGTVRRLDVLDISKRDITEQGKRLFVNAFTVRISSEIAPEVYNRVYKALQVDVTGTGDNQVIGRGDFTDIDSITITAP